MTTQITPAVQLRGLSKRFGDHVAVDGIDLTVPPGTFFGIVGPNGAGKSTTLSMIAGLLSPDAGSVKVAGHDAATDRDRVLSELGIMMEGLSLPERLTGAELLEYTARLRRIGDDWPERAADLLEVLELDRAPSTLIVDYSTGMRKKIGLAVALLHRPSVLVLDEPFEAIDPVSARAIEGLLEQFVAGGGTVLLSSHLMDVVERTCERVALIKDGRILAEGTVDGVRAGRTLNDTFVDLVGAPVQREIRWLA
ncbi:MULTISPECIES: ABC transporter ATP-binding protein [unclassified Microbacterium]|uniref:ABC transporter ATP-binding protein n=1 Tax=unclassified Microbacterium TaxID=2609290 RepID=UPI000EA8D91D|nr:MULTISPECIES: ABC transporter ATP-binding protein [unclassified Microbacterium]MBT2486425.1 ABC transporter ATP-binding protein [Microbacterium sp. ISL-108]RKN69127.1 ABC transporter ATP-binding protein [Microbacterium sp. CGR2]